MDYSMSSVVAQNMTKEELYLWSNTCSLGEH